MDRRARPNAPETRMAVMKRRAKLLQILNDHADESPSYTRLVELMLEDKFVRDNWPGYSTGAAHKDFTEVFGLIEGDVKDLAELYFIRQLTLNEEITDKLREFVYDDDIGPKLQIDAAKTLRGFLQQNIDMFGNRGQSKMAKPVLEVNIDTFMPVYQESIRQLEKAAEIIEGEVA